MTEHDHNPDPDDDGKPSPEDVYGELFREKADALEPVARRVGLYMRDAGLAMNPIPNDDGTHGAAMIVNMTVGDAAWSDRVQNPDKDSDEAQFRKMAVELEKDKFEETRAELEKRLREGKDILGGEDDD